MLHFQDSIRFEQERGQSTHLPMLVFEGQNAKNSNYLTIALLHCGLVNSECKEMTSLLHTLQAHFQGVALEIDILQYMEHKLENITHELLYNVSFLKERVRHVVYSLQQRFTNLILMPCGIVSTALVNILAQNESFKVRGVISCLKSDKNSSEVIEKLKEWDANVFYKPTLLLWDCQIDNPVQENGISLKQLYYPFHSSFANPTNQKKVLQEKILSWVNDS